jgi:Domain of unknown function (DUF4430)
VHRWALILAALALLFAVAPVANATPAHVRVEGKTRTIFGATEPLIDASTPLDALEAASVRGEFYYHVASSQFGNYVDQVGRFGASGTSGWVFKVNGVLPPVGADQVLLKKGDHVLWYFATFSGPTGPPTLELQRQPHGCYRVLAQDDQGKTTPARGSTLTVGGRKLATKNARACIGRHQGLVRATMPGAIRSGALR